MKKIGMLDGKNATRFRKSAIALSLGAAIFAAPVVSPSLNGETALPQAQAASADIVNASEARKDAWRQEILNLVNAHRKANGLAPYKYSRYLSGIAQDESNRAVRDENYNHSMNFTSDRRAGTWNDAGEVTALSYQIKPSDLVTFWKGSPAHNKMLLSKNIDVVGIGVTEVDGSLSRTKQPWRLLGVIDGFSYDAGKAPSDTRSSVTGGTAPKASSGYAIKGGIGKKYHADGGAAAYGTPTMNERSDGQGGVYQEFVKGSASYTIYWTPQYNVHVIKTSGAIGKKWKESGGRNGLGVPTRSESAVNGGVYQTFAKGSAVNKVMWKSGIGAFNVKERTAIGDKWKSAGFERGYGFHTGDERPAANGGTYQTFRNGSSVYKVMWKSGIGARVIKETGGIGEAWKAAGYERGYGYPTSDEYREGNGTVSQNFQKGKLSWRNGAGVWWRSW